MANTMAPIATEKSTRRLATQPNATTTSTTAHHGLLRKMDSMNTSMSSKGWVMARKVLE